MNPKYLTAFIVGITFFACRQPEQRPSGNNPPVLKDTTVKEQPVPEPPRVTYHFIKKKEWQSAKDSFEGARHLDILNAVNRTDSVHLLRLDSILVPSDYSLPLNAYLPFPTEVPFLKEVKKIIVFSLPAQVFAAYENGSMVLTGQTNTGRKTKPTPPRLYFTNWKARQTTSTVDDEWILKWNFNVHNTWGIGFHQYALPGYPASHSCMRLQERDARFLYGWADQWLLKNNQLLAAGTPVVVFGQYPFGQPKPWYRLVQDPAALTISADSLKNRVAPWLPEILKKQQQRDSLLQSTAVAAK
ncbi:L,D-transpeptidase [Niabella beijingensis]|uniref:L,D-transpeptidase n=1 Tax=Niabella beijingensis TaxID=2872700 RepID=UPI001CBF397C|nr:L,D-transpeptidase [Niabella beijingensis]MBZ4187317.1 L,D-transpeptidase [Niabella beijingensis]